MASHKVKKAECGVITPQLAIAKKNYIDMSTISFQEVIIDERKLLSSYGLLSLVSDHSLICLFIYTEIVFSP